MPKTDIKNFAIYARRELLKQVEARALRLGLSEGMLLVNVQAQAVNGIVLDKREQQQRQALIQRIRGKGFKAVMDEVAYTWFNRLIALRFMEVNGYLLRGMLPPFSPGGNEFRPPMLDDADTLDLPGRTLNRDYINTCLDNNRREELYRYLMTELCNSMSAPLPGMFGHIDDATALLFPDNALNRDGVIARMVRDIPEEDWRDSVQTIGWLYQYYNTEPKDAVFAALKKNVKISKENIPAATQLFTPDWIVRYMVENSLGRLWVEGHPDADMQFSWKYYLPEPEQEPEVEAQLAGIRKEYAKLNPEDIRCIDPCAGSGHILVYMFDVLMQIYISQGYTERDAVRSIICNNLYGLDIDDRAAQLAYFAVMMKAVQYDKRFLSRQNIPTPNVYAIQESPADSEWPALLHEFAGSDRKLRADMTSVLEDMRDAKTYGSAITARKVDFAALYTRLNEMMDLGNLHGVSAPSILLPLVQCAELLSQQYHAVVTNPPYMGRKNMDRKMADYLSSRYKGYDTDLFAAFVSRASQMCLRRGFTAFLTPYVWMFIKSYEQLRHHASQKNDIQTLIQFEYSAFEEATVPICSFVLQQSNVNKKGSYLRLTDFTGGMGVQEAKTLAAIRDKECRYYYECPASNFSTLPGAPVVYWASKHLLQAFVEGTPLSHYASPKQGMSTCNVDRFTRLWHEVNLHHTNLREPDNTGKWVKYNKGGSFRKWFGNQEYLVYWGGRGAELLSNGALLRNRDVYFKPFLAWTKISSAGTGFRKFGRQFLFDGAGGSLFTQTGFQPLPEDYLLALLNSKVTSEVLTLLSPTLNFNESHIAAIPVKTITNIGTEDEIKRLTAYSVTISRQDWDSFETSWDFERHPMVGRGVDTVEEAFAQWERECDDRFYTLKANEEGLNRIFIDIYGLQDELTPEVEEKDVTVRKADLERDVRSLISYAVGCMFGRYSLDSPGLAYAGGNFSDQWTVVSGQCFLKKVVDNYTLSPDHSPLTTDHFGADDDNIIPIGDVDGACEDDVCTRFIEFVGKVYGKAKLEQNLTFIANALGGRGSAREVIRKYFQKDFYTDHCKIYQKRPIYWLFESGKKGGFRALVYLHRYDRDTLARMRTDYVFVRQAHLRHDEERLANAQHSGTGNASKIAKDLGAVREQQRELTEFEVQLHHLADSRIDLDLDDGVVVNYAKFAPLVPKIK